jgi:catalase
MMGEDPHWLSRDLVDSIHKGNYPKWKLCVQLMTEEQGYTYPYTFDSTKVWPHTQFPLMEIGTLELNKNVVDYFSEVEEAAFSPANIVPGIGHSPDKLLQGRLLVYDDAQHHRIGPNHKQVPVNMPHKAVANNMWNLGGNMQMEVKNKFPHYYPNSFSNVKPEASFMEPPMKVFGPVGYYDFSYDGTDADYYTQPREFFRLLAPLDRDHLILNMADSLRKVTAKEVVDKVLSHLNKIDPTLGNGVSGSLKQQKEGGLKKSEAEVLVDDMRQRLHLESAH